MSTTYTYTYTNDNDSERLVVGAVHFVYNLMFLIAGIKWGDWRNWKLYYPTIWFFIGGDLLMNMLLHDYLFWEYKESIFGSELLFSHKVISLLIMGITYPMTILIYHGHFPHTKVKILLWYLFWVSSYSVIEYINTYHLNLFENSNGWTFGWSIFFNICMFALFPIHHKRPLLALSLGFIMVIFL